MNYRLISKILGIVAFFIGASMFLSLPWAFTAFGGDWEYERAGFLGILCAVVISFGVGTLLAFLGRGASPQLLRKESMAVVPLSWILAIFLASLPYLLSGTGRAPEEPMNVADAVFESTSGLTTTGATVLADLETPELVPRTILFWRATTHFLGGLGIMVFFVVLLGYGTAGKTIMMIEKGGSSGPGGWGRIRKFAFALAGIYIGLIAVMAALLLTYGVAPFDALCHAFSTLSTGGFSTFNASVGHFASETDLNAPLIESTVIFFMILGGTNFILLYFVAAGKPRRLFEDVEWQTYIGILFAAALIVFVGGLICRDFDPYGTSDFPMAGAAETGIAWHHALRQSLFQVTSLMTSTGFVTDEFEKWNSLSLFVFLIIVFIGGCVGGTSGGVKVLRIITAVKTFNQELEKTYRPNVVRPIKIGNLMIDKTVQYSMVTYVAFFAVSVAAATLFVLMIEPPGLWTDAGQTQNVRMLDIFSSTLSMFANIGPGFGVTGARENFGGLSSATKLVFSWAMLFGRLELYLPLLLFTPAFWRK